jgi:ribosome-associated heat shock protein Hsp15
MNCRVDKYVWAIRLAKTRSLASELISKGKIKINNSTIKPSRDVKVGDTIQVLKNTATFSFEIVKLLDKRVGAKLLEEYVIDTTPPEEKEKFEVYKLSQQVYRENGSGKPTKKDRRDLGDFLES